jgi:hypothetical protein
MLDIGSIPAGTRRRRNLDAPVERHGALPPLGRLVLADRPPEEQVHEQRRIAVRCAGI